jgi:hypothetical protein
VSVCASIKGSPRHLIEMSSSQHNLIED